jgi:hypothetical protein
MTDTNLNKWNLGMGRINYNYKLQDLLDLATGKKKDE